MFDLSGLDYIALAVAFGLWAFFTWLVDHSPWARTSLSAMVGTKRLEWMIHTCGRENRIFDGALLGNLMHSISFLASATIIILGGIVALAGAVDHFYDTVSQMPFVATANRATMELKLLGVGLIFLYCFLKFTWSLRQFNYCCILVGAAPETTASDEVKREFAKQAARVGELGARSFSQGLRGYYFALVAVGWFIHPYAMIGAAIWVLLILCRREYWSKTRRALRGK